MSDRTGLIKVAPVTSDDWRAMQIQLSMDVNALQDILTGHGYWQILLDPQKGAAVLVNGFRGVTGDWVLVDLEGVASIVKAAEFSEQWRFQMLAPKQPCPDCTHPSSQHSPAGCWHMDGVIRCTCATRGRMPTEVARSEAGLH